MVFYGQLKTYIINYLSIHIMLLIGLIQYKINYYDHCVIFFLNTKGQKKAIKCWHFT